ncbi:MAG: hypothetical protein Q7T33_07805 [Dehalococcoidia bacterium]|nr:hypothetical protein [Dehalococcoidia bacterium]
MRRTAVLVLAAAVTTGGVFAGLIATGAFGQGGGPPPEKQAFEEAERAAEQAAQNLPHASKVPKASPVVSCPNIDLASLKTGIYQYDPRYPSPPFWRYGNLVSIATAISSQGVPYTIYTGSGIDPQQGVIVVDDHIIVDTCAVVAGLASPLPEPKWYETPSRAGAVTLTQIDGDTLIFTTADGATGRFEYTTAQFVTLSAAP